MSDCRESRGAWSTERPFPACRSWRRGQPGRCRKRASERWPRSCKWSYRGRQTFRKGRGRSGSGACLDLHGLLQPVRSAGLGSLRPTKTGKRRSANCAETVVSRPNGCRRSVWNGLRIGLGLSSDGRKERATMSVSLIWKSGPTSRGPLAVRRPTRLSRRRGVGGACHDGDAPIQS